MSERTYQGRGFTDAYIAQYQKALGLYGQDELASTLSPARVTPRVSGALALEIARFWLAVAPACVRRALEGADPDHPWLVVTNYAGSTTWVHRHLAEQAIDRLQAGKLIDEQTIKIIGSRSETAADILRALEDMFFAIKNGSVGPLPRTTSIGRIVMQPVQGRLFWDSARRCATSCSGSTASVTADEKWSEFKEAIKEQARAVAEAAGEAAGFVAATAGQAIGSGVGGFIGELGIVNVALIGAGAYVAVKVL